MKDKDILDILLHSTDRLTECEIKAIKNLIARYKELEEKYKRLSIEAQATAFNDDNKDTEGLLRVLLKQDEISLDENGYYKRQDFDWEKNMFMLGLMKKREKTFYIPDDECLDEYPKQLESQLKEYNKIKEIFKKYYVMENETIYDGCCKMQDEIDKYKELQNKLDKENIPIETLLAELNRLEDIEDDRDCNYISKNKVKEKIEELENNYMVVARAEDEITAIQHNRDVDVKIQVLQELLRKDNNGRKKDKNKQNTM